MKTINIITLKRISRDRRGKKNIKKKTIQFDSINVKIKSYTIVTLLLLVHLHYQVEHGEKKKGKSND